MKKYIHYEIEERKYSSNCIIGVYLQLNTQTNKMDEIKDKILAPFVPKKEGDIITNQLLCYLNSTL